MEDTRQKDVRTFEDYFGMGDEGYTSEESAKSRKAKVDAELKGATGEVDYFSEVTKRSYDGKFWVHVVRKIDYNHPDRIAAGL